MTNSDKLTIMQEAGKIASFILTECLQATRPGISTWEINQVAEKLMEQENVFPAFKLARNYKTGEKYSYATCITINEEIVHGLPKKENVIKPGDIVTIDLGIRHQGFYVDTGWTVLCQDGNQDQKRELFLKAGEKTLDKALTQCIKGKTVGDISFAIQDSLLKDGLIPEVELVGHGIGKKMHQEPDIPCVGRLRTGLQLEVGMTLAVEVIYKSGKSRLYTKTDGWTMAAKDGILAALFELTIAVGEKNPVIITPYPFQP